MHILIHKGLLPSAVVAMTTVFLSAVVLIFPNVILALSNERKQTCILVNQGNPRLKYAVQRKCVQ